MSAATYIGKQVLPTSVSGVVSVSNGGTGATTLSGLVKGNGSGAFTAVTAPAGAVVGTTDTQTLTNKTVTSAVINGGYTEQVFTIVDGASVDLNPANGSIQTWTLGANRTATATSFASGQSMILGIDDGTAYTVTWPSVAWTKVGGSGIAPALNANVKTWVVLWKVGSTLYGSHLGDA